MKWTNYFIALLITIIAVSSIANAQPKNEQKQKKQFNMHEKLNLTDQQKDKIEGLRTEHQKRMVDLNADLKKKQIEMRELKNKGNYSRSEVLAQVDKLSKVKDQIAKEKANHRMDVYEQLTPDQKKIFDEMPLNRKGKFGRGFRNGNGPGDCPDCPRRK